MPLGRNLGVADVSQPNALETPHQQLRRLGDERGEAPPGAFAPPAAIELMQPGNRFIASIRAAASRRVLASAAAVLATGLVALALPVSTGAGAGAQDRSFHAAASPALAPAEDLSAFLASRRWGVSLAEADAARRAAAEAARAAEAGRAPTALERIGFVGLTGSAQGAGKSPGWKERKVLLVLPDGGLGRFAVGDALPDGRLLTAIADNALSLAAQGETEVIELFPAPDAGRQ